MKIICISDTHNKHQNLTIPEGDLIIHAGDFTVNGTKAETFHFLGWFAKLPHKHKILIAGNHDFYLEKYKDRLNEIIPNEIYYLMDSGIRIENVNFWGSPYTPGDGNWAFNKSRGSQISQHWNKIPLNTDILITHGPPFGILDELDNKQQIGCEKLANQVLKLNLKYHVFGHVHNDYGIERTKTTIFINSASLDEKNRSINAPLIFMLKNLK